MLQQIIIAALFLAALFFLGRMVWMSFRSKKAVGGSCAKCAPENQRSRQVV